MRLHGFFRSSAAWRVRIALAIKGASYDAVPRNFRKAEQRAAGYLTLNPQGLVPALETGEGVLIQSLAIIEYLEETLQGPALLPSDAFARAQVRGMAQLIACDIHPINNLRILDYLRGSLRASDDAVNDWYRYWVEAGFAALEILVAKEGDGRHCFGNSVTIADLCLVPQMYNARRFGVDVAAYPKLVAVDAHLCTLDAFATTVPEQQADAV